MLLWLMISTLSPPVFSADKTEATKPATQASVNEPTQPVSINNPDHTSPGNDQNNRATHLHQAAPYLNQALIIFTSTNGILIVCGVVLIVLKERLHRQSAKTLASLKATNKTTQIFAAGRNKDIT
ncbi:hypothetical protein [Kaarinaea lacus]